MYTTIKNIPTTVLAILVHKYSQHKIAIYNNSGTFWHGNGLIVVLDERSKVLAPLLLVNWDIKFGYKKFIDIIFKVGDKQIMDVYLDKNGLNLTKLNVSLSISQVSEIFGLIKNMGLSGDLLIKSNQIKLVKNKIIGVFEINLNSLSSAISPVNPLGNYSILMNLETNNIKVSTNEDSVLKIDGDGNFNSLILNSVLQDSKKEKMLQFMTMMGIPQPNGSYQLKIF